MKTKHLNFEIFNTYSDWFSILPVLDVKHKYWYLWSISFGWLCWNFTLEITRRDWLHKGNFVVPLELGDFVLDKVTNKTGQIVMEDSDTIYVQFPDEVELIEYSKNDGDIQKVGTEREKDSGNSIECMIDCSNQKS